MQYYTHFILPDRNDSIYRNDSMDSRTMFLFCSAVEFVYMVC